MLILLFLWLIAIAAAKVFLTMADENHKEVPVHEDGASEPSNGNEQDSVELAPASQKDGDDVKGELFCFHSWILV